MPGVCYNKDMLRPFRTIIALMLSVALAWLPMQSVAAMSDGASRDGTPQAGSPRAGSAMAGSAMAQQAVPCHSTMASGDASADLALSETANCCCCDGCDSSCDSGCVQGSSMAVLSSDNRFSADKHHVFRVSASVHLNGLSYSPPLPPPLV